MNCWLIVHRLEVSCKGDQISEIIFLFLLVSGAVCGLWFWHFLYLLLTFSLHPRAKEGLLFSFCTMKSHSDSEKPSEKNFKLKSEMRSFKSNENIHKKEGGSYYVVEIDDEYISHAFGTASPIWFTELAEKFQMIGHADALTHNECAENKVLSSVHWSITI